jgi:hypothetical protein
MKGRVLAFFSLILLSACAQKMQTGSVNPMTVDYPSMEKATDVKTVSFRCDYDKVARADFKKHGDYCGYAKNSDYVSYFIPPDTQSTNSFRYFAAHNAKLFFEDGLNSPYKYYQVFTGMNLERLKKFDFNDLPPIGFAVTYDEDIILGFTAKELLARLYIAPTLTVNSFELKARREGVTFSDYEATYQIPPYKFTLKMLQPSMARFLGLPDSERFPGALSQRQTGELALYNGLLKASLEKRDMNRYGSFRQAHVHPYLADGTPGFIKTVSPLAGEGFFNEYLPPYRLYQIEIFIIDNKTGALRLSKLFKFDDILRVIISPEDFPVLFYRHKYEKVMVRYTHIALPPKLVRNKNIDALGAPFIYSDMARRIQTELYIEKFYDISGLSKICVNEEQYKKRLAERGYNESDIKVFQSYLKDARDACTPNQLEIIEHLPEIILKTVPR